MGTEMCLKDAARFVRVLDANAAKPVYYYILRMVSTYVGLVRRMGGMFSTRTVLFCFCSAAGYISRFSALDSVRGGCA